jgi:predicted dehydrogenase
MAQQFGVPKTYADINLMACDSEIDAVLISAPNNLHAPISIEMLQSGKHVLCEKPMAVTEAEAERTLLSKIIASPLSGDCKERL